MKKSIFLIAITAAVFFSTRLQAQVKNIVLVHGAFTDGSGWKKLYTILKSRGYHVSIVGNPNTGLEDDVVATKRVLSRQKGPVILVGHSYGGAIISIAGNAPNVAGLVYIAAFSPDEGESLGKLVSTYPVDPLSATLPPQDGFIWCDAVKFHEGFCADLPKKKADFMFASQVPVAASAFEYVFKKEIAWKTKPSWHIVATEDHALSADLERRMGRRTAGVVSEIKGSHLVFISHAREVANIIDAAAKATKG